MGWSDGGHLVSRAGFVGQANALEGWELSVDDRRTRHGHGGPFIR